VTPEATRKLFEELSRDAWALSAIGVAAQRGMFARLLEGSASVAELAEAAGLEPVTTAAVVDVVVAIGLASRSSDRVALADGMRTCLGDLGPDNLGCDATSTLGAALAPLLRACEPGAAIGGWPANERAIARAQGRVSGSATKRMIAMLDAIPGLRERLARPGASMLDIGAGAAGLAIAMAQAFPELRVIGIEPSSEALTEARSAIAAARLGSRIAMRQQLGQDLDDDGLHAYAWVAQMFVPDDAIDAVWRATWRALEPGGVVCTLSVATVGDDFFSAVSRWRNVGWGGGARTPDVVVAQLEAAGFAEIVAMPTPAGTAFTPIVARRPTP
jgi:precorrin-6B methylase 2